MKKLQRSWTVRTSPPKVRPISFDTDRFRVRALTQADASERYAAWYADPEVMPVQNAPTRELSVEILKQHISSFDHRSRHLLGIFDKSNDLHVGVYIVDVLQAHRIAKLQIMIGDAAYRGIGVASEAGTALITYLFEKQKIEKVVGQVLASNTRTISVIKKVGFQLEGELKGEVRCYRSGGRLDQYLYGVLKSDWPFLSSNSGKPKD